MRDAMVRSALNAAASAVLISPIGPPRFLILRPGWRMTGKAKGSLKMRTAAAATWTTAAKRARREIGAVP